MRLSVISTSQCPQQFRFSCTTQAACSLLAGRLHHFTAPVEDAVIHFVHERSSRPDAVPLLIIHGWPGSSSHLPLPLHPSNLHHHLISPTFLLGLFYDFRNIIAPLTNPSDPKQPAFHVVAPSLPGYAWSSLPRKTDFTVEDTARLFDTLMVEVLGYKEYLGQGGDWVRTSSIPSTLLPPLLSLLILHPRYHGPTNGYRV